MLRAGDRCPMPISPPSWKPQKEVAYRVAKPMEIGLGLLYNQRRFRLDDSGPAPYGVGEDNNLSLRLRLGWDIISQSSLALLGGGALGGEVQLDDRNGNRI